MLSLTTFNHIVIAQEKFSVMKKMFEARKYILYFAEALHATGVIFQQVYCLSVSVQEGKRYFLVRIISILIQKRYLFFLMVMLMAAVTAAMAQL